MSDSRERSVLTLVDALVAGRDTGDMVQLIAGMLRNPVILFDSAYSVIAMAGEDFEDEIWQSSRKLGCCSAESVIQFKKDVASMRLFQGDKAFRYDTGLGARVPRILSKIPSATGAAGYLVVFEVNEPLGAEHEQLCDALCGVLSLAVKLQFQPDIVNRSALESALFALLEARPLSRETLEQRLLTSGWAMQGMLHALVVEDAREGISAYYRDFIRARLDGQLSPFCKSVVLRNHVVFLLNHRGADDFAHDLALVRRFLQDNRLIGGVSKGFSSIGELHAHWQQAGTALRLGPRLWPERALFRYRDCAIYQMFSALGAEELGHLRSTAYRKLREHDAANHSQYTASAVAYLRHGLQLTPTSEELCIHRNTMKYRLDRIAAISGLDFADGEALMQFLLSHKIDKWLSVCGAPAGGDAAPATE